jgi:gliding motility-associated-like protein
LSISGDIAGDIYVTGYFAYQITFGAYTLMSGSPSTIFVVKYDASGNSLWAKSAGNGNGDVAYSVATDAFGNAYVTGAFTSSSITFGTYTLLNAGGTNVFLVKYDASGNVLWARSAGGTKDDEGYCLAADVLGNIYLSGGFTSSSITFGSITLPFPAGGIDPMVIVKYDSAGTALCASALPSGGDIGPYTYNSFGNGIATDAYCNVYTGSDFNINLFNVGADTLLLTGTKSVFVAKYTCNVVAKESHVNVKCYGQCTGTATAIPAGGGTSPYIYSWSNGQTAQTATGLCAGTYTATITDSMPCLASIIVTIKQPTAPLTYSTTVITNYCNATYAGSAIVNASGGTPSYSYSWSNGQTSSASSNLPAGTYSVIISDNNGCADTSTVTIPAFPPPVPSITGADSICSGNIDMLNASGGVSYSWSTGATSQSISVSPTSQSTYSVTVTSSNGCKADTSFRIIVNPRPTTSAVSNIITPVTYGQSATLTASGGVSYTWSNGDNGNIIIVFPTATTVYCVTATDSNNCSDTSCVTVAFQDVCASGVYLPNAFSPNNDGENDFLQLYSENTLCVTSLHIIIYDRWGEKCFESIDPIFKWDGTYKGTLVNTQVVAYYLKATLIDGKEISQKGNISLIR